MDEKKRVYIRVYGIVQGVNFRYYTRELARKLGLYGTVKNLFDGSVEIVAEGEEEKLQKLISFAKRGPPAAQVYDIEVKWEKAQGNLPFFTILY